MDWQSCELTPLYEIERDFYSFFSIRDKNVLFEKHQTKNETEKSLLNHLIGSMEKYAFVTASLVSAVL